MVCVVAPTVQVRIASPIAVSSAAVATTESVVFAGDVDPSAGETSATVGGMVSPPGGGGGGGGVEPAGPSRSNMNCTEFCVEPPHMHARGEYSPHCASTSWKVFA